MNCPWRERMGWIRTMPLEKKVQRSLQVLEAVVKEMDDGLPLIVNFSGGKDSVACMLLAREVTDRVELCYVDGGFDLPETLRYVREQAERFGLRLHVPRPGEVSQDHREDGIPAHVQVFEDYVRWYGYWPTAARRWCSCWCKQRVMKNYWRQLYDANTVLYKLNGVRMFESPTRLWKYGNPKHFRKYTVNGSYFLRHDSEHRPCICVYPVIEWTVDDVVAYIASRGVELHAGYKLFGVSGCKWCPVHTPDVYRRILSVHPELYDDFIALEGEINRPAVQGGVWLRDLKREVVGP